MGNSGGRHSTDKTVDLTAPNIVLMKTKYGKEAIEPLDVWVKKFRFPQEGTFCMRPLMQAQETIEFHLKKMNEMKVSKNERESVEKHLKALKMWKHEAECRERWTHCREGPFLNELDFDEFQTNNSVKGITQKGTDLSSDRQRDREIENPDSSPQMAPPAALTNPSETSPPCTEPHSAPTHELDSTSDGLACIDTALPQTSLFERLWPETDIDIAMSHLPHPRDSGKRFADELKILCKMYSPTLLELRQLLVRKLGVVDWVKVAEKVPAGNYQRVESNWAHSSNENYRQAVMTLCAEIETAFPPCTKVSACKQTGDETVSKYVARPFDVFNNHSGLDQPDRNIQEATKFSCIDWEDGKLSGAYLHDIHTENNMKKKQMAWLRRGRGWGQRRGGRGGRRRRGWDQRRGGGQVRGWDQERVRGQGGGRGGGWDQRRGGRGGGWGQSRGGRGGGWGQRRGGRGGGWGQRRGGRVGGRRGGWDQRRGGGQVRDWDQEREREQGGGRRRGWDQERERGEGGGRGGGWDQRRGGGQVRDWDQERERGGRRGRGWGQRRGRGGARGWDQGGERRGSRGLSYNSRDVYVDDGFGCKGQLVKDGSDQQEASPAGHADRLKLGSGGAPLDTPSPSTHLKANNTHNSNLATPLPEAEILALQEVPKTLWAQGKHDVGLVKNAEPVVITPKSDYRPWKKQYPLKQNIIDGITPVFEAFRKAGVIVPCRKSPVRSPALPIRKDGNEWRFVLDLRAVNAAVQQRASSVPNPDAVLSQVPSDACWFSVVDIANASYSIPVHPDSQYWFSFQFNGKSYTFTRLCQGYCETSTILYETLRKSLGPLQLTQGTTLLQYIDDLMICSPTQDQCQKDTVTLLKHLAKEGYKAGLSKLQFVKQKVIFLGYEITAEGRALLPKRIEDIQNIHKPNTKKQMLSFLGKCSSCKTFIPNYTVLEAPLNTITQNTRLLLHHKVTWTPEAEQAFEDLKTALQTTPTLAFPDTSRPFTQTVDERNGCMTSALLQVRSDTLRPVAYFSETFDRVSAGLPRCLRAVAAAEKAVLASRRTVGDAALTLLNPHAVERILLEQKTSKLSTEKWQQYNTALLKPPNITIKRCNILNPATLLPMEGEADEHDCVALLKEA